ncbi:TetR family transcriptional regulator [Sphaerisporangium krabiense]|uniref:AcrR family transcriptional regulator n=1 Tax=Sphaerisporangium krabiense TaxID=763782 RepID=A0A7W8Z3V5_9ACTN|nr:TetR/AcrR family transcriptional regulator C-terminal domain-containing protein [Sphaerisporangium krabiense]MBB5626982.1 AcrR family transcriptional regulator [Sphaerisporangium krabiense]GII66785.1 TetR family transcriptional regulator [Sphaerisporangium krabiense]
MEDAAESTPGLWQRLAAGERDARRPRLSHQRIAESAFRIAEAEGLDNVTMRRVAADLGSSTMALYRYVQNKEELHELLLDEAIGRMGLPERRTGDWRADLRALAFHQLGALRRLPWVLSLRTLIPSLGPNSLRVREYVLSLLDGLGLTIDEMMQIAALVQAQVAGAVEAERLLSRHAWGDEDARARWQATHAAYVGELLATGRYPYLGRVVAEAEHPPIESSFAFGLDILLDGLAARLAR